MYSVKSLIVVSSLILLSYTGGTGDALGDPEEASKAVLQTANTKMMTVEGTLEYYPQDVMSVQAWLGHEFMIGGTPIRPTDAVSSETLRKMVGKRVKVEGVCNAGEKWVQTGEGEDSEHPAFPVDEIVIRRSGIDVKSLTTADE